jgi:TonB family protein
MRGVVVGLFAVSAALIASAATAQEAPPQLLYPRAALEQGVGGEATVRCMVRDDGHLTCEVMQESPQGVGFGDAVLAMSESWRMPTQKPDGTSTAGGLVVRTVEFSPGPPPVVRERPSQVAAPRWEVTPTAQHFARYYPQQALQRGISGEVLLDCLVNEDHRIACEVASETPERYGFGEAALRISQHFRMAPTTRDGVPTAGGRVRVPINFHLR